MKKKLEIEIIKRNKISDDLVLCLTYYTGIGFRSKHVGLFIKEYGYYQFRFKDDTQKKLFTAVFSSKNPVRTFLKIHRRLTERMLKKEVKIK